MLLGTSLHHVLPSSGTLRRTIDFVRVWCKKKTESVELVVMDAFVLPEHAAMCMEYLEGPSVLDCALGGFRGQVFMASVTWRSHTFIVLVREVIVLVIFFTLNPGTPAAQLERHAGTTVVIACMRRQPILNVVCPTSSSGGPP